jgi:hypothetical protein
MAGDGGASNEALWRSTSWVHARRFIEDVADGESAARRAADVLVTAILARRRTTSARWFIAVTTAGIERGGCRKMRNPDRVPKQGRFRGLQGTG